MMNITYLMHSCYLVELDSSYLLFDYFNGSRQESYQRDIVLPELEKEKWLYVFSSHFHADHFGIEVLHWRGQRENISYILSKDIRLGENFLLRHGIDPSVKEDIIFVKPGKEYECRDLKIQTLFSTDAGVAYIIEAEGKRLYHAGDLNWWYWENETEDEMRNMERHYKSYLKKAEGLEFDAAFVPYDPKLNEHAICGIRYFLQVTNTKRLFPMHFWGMYEAVGQLASQLPYDLKTEIYIPLEEGQHFTNG